MHTFKNFPLSFVLCFSMFTTVKANNFFDVSASKWNHDSVEDFTVFNSPESLEIVADDDLDIQEGCRCLNGKCEKQCVEVMNGVCRRTANVCVCGPEFFKVNDETCEYCDCGRGFNCSFHHGQNSLLDRTCSCPEGFYEFNYRCVAKCNETNPCQNGGNCVDGKCYCNWGTYSAFCELSFWCAEKCNQSLLVDCVYDKEKDDFSCLCKNRSLMYDFEQRVCKPCKCEPGGMCVYDNGTLVCNCYPRYQEIDGECKPCYCGPYGKCEKTQTGETICRCKDGELSRGGHCTPCNCWNEDATCKTNKEGRKVCICPYGYEDIEGKCIKMNKDDRRCLCHPTANCVETNDKFNEFNCTCKEGFKGKFHDIPQVGEECIDIDECQDSKNCPDRETTECVNFEGSFMCRCKSGYQPANNNADPLQTACKKYKISWTPTGIAIGIIVAFIAISVGGLLYLRHRSHFFLSASGIEMQQAKR